MYTKSAPFQRPDGSIWVYILDPDGEEIVLLPLVDANILLSHLNKEQS